MLRHLCNDEDMYTVGRSDAVAETKTWYLRAEGNKNFRHCQSASIIDPPATIREGLKLILQSDLVSIPPRLRMCVFAASDTTLRYLKGSAQFLQA